MIIEAADVEKYDAEKRAQTIIAFKADTTTARWDQVRQLTSDEEWAQVKEELVVYVLKQNTQIKDKIELLLKDGLYKQVIEVFPSPSGKEEELTLLLQVYKTIEEKEPVLLEKMIPVVARYMKRYFQEQKYDRMYPILDRFQRRFPGIIVSLLANACDTVMFGILPSQYAAFVQMLKLMKQRLENINKQEDWTTFFVGFKRKHMGKKRLIQMINLLGDSSWNMEQIFAGDKSIKIKDEWETKSEKKKKKQKSKSRRSASSTHRKKRKTEKKDLSDEEHSDNAESSVQPVDDAPLPERPGTPETESVEEEPLLHKSKTKSNKEEKSNEEKSLEEKLDEEKSKEEKLKEEKLDEEKSKEEKSIEEKLDEESEELEHNPKKKKKTKSNKSKKRKDRKRKLSESDSN